MFVHLMRKGGVLLIGLAAAGLMMTSPAEAYVGPGAGLTAIGTALALVLAILLAVVGFVWYPLKRLMRKRKTVPADDMAATGAEKSQ